MFFSTNEGIPGDGRCLFRDVAHGSCIRSGKPAPSKNLQRELADELRARAILLPAQDRVLTIRENARLQGFPDYYKLLGPIKERYIQVGNAVAVPVARALGYSLAMSSKGIADAVQPTFSLPPNFPNMQPSAASPSTDQESQ